MSGLLYTSSVPGYEEARKGASLCEKWAGAHREKGVFRARRCHSLAGPQIGANQQGRRGAVRPFEGLELLISCVVKDTIELN